MNQPVSTDILLIEHNPFEAEVTKSAILKSMITDKIHWARDGEEAMNFIFGNTDPNSSDLANLPRIIIMDLKIPKISGIEILRRIKENPATSKIIIILLSSSEESADFLQAINSGVNMCIVKKPDLTSFANKIKQELGYYWRLFDN
jgi:two-component system response regulator